MVLGCLRSGRQFRTRDVTGSNQLVKTATPEQQAEFFRKLQLLLTEGDYVSSYKYALLIALARWAVENPDHEDSEPLDIGAVAPHFTELYWPHVLPFRAGSGLATVAEPAADAAPWGWQSILVQDRGQQMPRVLKLIREHQRSGCSRVSQLPEVSRSALLRQVRSAILAMPLWRLHRVRGSDDPVRFLYRRGPRSSQIRFEDGMVACLAAFAPLIEEIVRSAWLRFVVRCNPGVLGAVSQVEEFLFPGSRAGLEVWRKALQEVQGDTCFYCQQPMRQVSAVDHFLPWSRYPRDLGHNFVLAHPKCNEGKSNHLASCEQLARWCARNHRDGEELAWRFDKAGLPHDWPTLRRVAGSLYQMAAACRAMVWQPGSGLVPLSADWQQVLAAS